MVIMVPTSNSIANNHQYKTPSHFNQSIERNFYYSYSSNGIEVEYEGNRFDKAISINDINDITNYIKKNFPTGTNLFIDENNKTIIFKSGDSSEKTYTDMYNAYYKFCVDNDGLASLKNSKVISRNYSIEVE